MQFIARGQLARGVLVVALLAAASFAYGEDYLDRDAFLHLAFGQAQPEMQTLWVTEDLRNAAETAVGWMPRALRLRYWQSGDSTAWILEDIGKEKPITLGISISGDRLERVDVLAFRESRGWEIRYPFFTGQFQGLTLADDGYLSERVDGITGATLSVRAVDRMTRLALWLNAQVRG